MFGHSYGKAAEFLVLWIWDEWMREIILYFLDIRFLSDLNNNKNDWEISLRQWDEHLSSAGSYVSFDDRGKFHTVTMNQSLLFLLLVVMQQPSLQDNLQFISFTLNKSWLNLFWD